MGRGNGAAALYQAAIDIRESVVAQNDSTTYRMSLRDDLIAYAEVLAELGDWSRSAAGYAKAGQYGAVGLGTATAVRWCRWRRETKPAIAKPAPNWCEIWQRRVARGSASDCLGVDRGKARYRGQRGSQRRSAPLPHRDIPERKSWSAAQYRAGMVPDATIGLAQSLRALEDDVDQRDQSLVVRLLGTMVLVDAYRDQNDTAALDAQLARLDELIIEVLVSVPAPQDDGLPIRSVRVVAEIARRQLSGLRQLLSTESTTPSPSDSAN